MHKVFDRKCIFETSRCFFHFKDDQVNAEYASRATRPRFFVNYVVHTSRLDKDCMHLQGLDNDRAKYAFNLVLCKNNKSN